MKALERMHLLLRRLSPDCGKELVGLGEKNSQQVEISSRLCKSLKTLKYLGKKGRQVLFRGCSHLSLSVINSQSL